MSGAGDTRQGSQEEAQRGLGGGLEEAGRGLLEGGWEEVGRRLGGGWEDAEGVENYTLDPQSQDSRGDWLQKGSKKGIF